MSTFTFRVVLAVSILVLATTVAAGVVAATQPSGDEQALQPIRQPADRRVESRVNDLLAKMTLEEKLQQIQLLPDFLVTDEGVKKGLGSVLSVTDPQRIRDLQRMAVEESRLKIPILFAFDTIHGFRTVFPIPLAAGASFDPQVAFDDHTYGARESAVVGLKQTYAPMVDVSHEPRWGRISEAAGEDPYLNSVLAAARVKAIQGSDYSAPDKLVASVKHFAAYGQPESGRDYNTTDMSVQRLWNFYLPPFKAAIDAGAGTVMCSFNAISGVPGCGNDELMNEILKGDWDFDGFVESDWTAVAEMRACPPKTPDAGECGHGVAADGPDAAALALNSGVDSEMTSTLIRDFGAQLLDDHRISMKRIDDAVRRILRVKFRAGLFEHPYAPFTPDKAEAQMLKPDAVAAARKAAGRSMVLLQNKGGDLAPQPREEDGRDRAARQERARHARSVVGCRPRRRRRDRLRRHRHAEPRRDLRRGLQALEHRAAAHRSRGLRRCRLRRRGGRGAGCGPGRARPGRDTRDERRGRSAQHARPSRPAGGADPGDQGDRKPYVVVLFNGRPLALEDVVGDAPALLEAWFPGVQAGPPSPTSCSARSTRAGSCPCPSRGARPGADLLQPRADRAAVQRGLEVQLAAPRHPELRAALRVRLRAQLHDVRGLEPAAEPPTVSRNGSLTASVSVTNTGTRKGDEVVQLYIHDPVASISQPVRRLRGFERVTLTPGETRRVTFTLDKSDFGFYDNRGKFVVEPGQIDVYAGNSSSASLMQSFSVQG